MEIMKNKELIIDRKIWLRGDKKRSRLLTHDGKAMCCLGIYLNSCGVSKKLLRSSFSPDHVNDKLGLPNEASWLMGVSNCSDAAYDLMLFNDSSSLFKNEKEREEKIKKLFAEVNIKVKFIGNGSP